MALPKFDPDSAEEYLGDQYNYYRAELNRIFTEENKGRDSANPIYSARYQKYLGKSLGYKEMLEYFKRFDLNPWTSTDNPPPKDIDVLLYGPTFNTYRVGCYKDIVDYGAKKSVYCIGYSCHEIGDKDTPTYWRALPNLPPKEEEKNVI